MVDRFGALPRQKNKKFFIQRFELSSSNVLAPARPFNSLKLPYVAAVRKVVVN